MPIDLPVAIAMVVIGVQSNSEKYCQVQEIPIYLIVAGTVYLITATLRYLSFCLSYYMDPEKNHFLYLRVALLVELLCNSCVILWGYSEPIHSK